MPSEISGLNILVTGASGFVGRSLVTALSDGGANVSAIVRNNNASFAQNNYVSKQIRRNIDGDTDWSELLIGIEVVIHLAAVTHEEVKNSNEELFHKVNVKGTEKLIKESIKAGVKRFVFVSTVKVYGEQDFCGQVLNEQSSVGEYCDNYGRSKLEAEKIVLALSQKSPIEFVIIRPPLVYGAQAKANYAALLKLIKTGIPLPFTGVRNLRSMIYIDNLVSFIVLCCKSVKAKNQIFLVSDGEDLSLPEIVHLCRKALSMPDRLIYIPIWLLKLLFFISGRKSQQNKLLGDLRVCSQKARKYTGWKPVVTIDVAMQNTMREFCERQ